jgi:anti-sigma factor RsiW
MHPAEDALESYALNRLPKPKLTIVEQHLLACEECRAEVRLVDGIVAALRWLRAAQN